ncbi:MAG: tetratricopeptide repeat protein [Planctomycetota bacterium]
MLIVQVGDFGTDGDAHYRIHAPARFMGLIDGVVCVDVHFHHHLLPMLAEKADVLVLQFFSDWDLIPLLSMRKKLGKLTIFEANDFFFDLQPWSPIANSWRDREIQELYLQLLRLSDGVQTSTAYLAEQWSKMGSCNVEVFPNQLVHLQPLPNIVERPFTVGWAGSPGHFADLYHVAPYLQNWLEAHPDAHLAIMTDELAQEFFHLDPARFHFKPFGSIESYLDFLGSIDVGIAPLLPTQYNKGRSDVKFLEYASCGVAGIYQNLEPYRNIVNDGETGLFFNTPEELISQLDRLYQDRKLRLQIRDQAYGFVIKQRKMEDHIGSRVEWYKSLDKKNSISEGVDDQILIALEGAGEKQAGYFQLRAGVVEKQFLEASAKTSANEQVESLKNLTQQQPAYSFGWLKLGECLNGLRQPADALKAFEKTLELMPYSSRAKIEIARSYFLLEDRDKAVALLKQVCLSETSFLPAWKYLLRLLAIQKAGDGIGWCKKADAGFPNCYSLSLIGLDNYSPEEKPVALLEILSRVGSTFSIMEHPYARDVLSRAVFGIVALPLQDKSAVIALLQKAHAVFPESTRIVAELGKMLYSTGKGVEAQKYFDFACSQKLASDLCQQECPTKEIPYQWQFSRFICQVLSP